MNMYKKYTIGKITKRLWQWLMWILGMIIILSILGFGYAVYLLNAYTLYEELSGYIAAWCVSIGGVAILIWFIIGIVYGD